jgi:predicted alpha/beta hydrolase family esterase
MRTQLSYTRRVLLLSALLISPAAVLTAQAADGQVKGATLVAPANERNAMASGAVEDTLKACLGRIPLNASAGQRLLAEQSCAGEHETRQVVPSAPKF